MNELFKLLGIIAVDNDEAIKALKETGEAGGETESKLNSAFGKIGKGAAVVGKVIGTAMVAGGAAVAGLATKAIASYADYEQLVGGVETLFGAGGQSIEEYAKSVGKSVDEASAEYEKLMSAQGKVLEYANKAYADAGMSANEYMETVTGFSASLIQSVGGDTEKAAEKANQALIDMSDNANKMGSNMEDIKNAYGGFAKQNYTMLDNLKLGYGGTQEEMKRLLADAQAISGVKYDISSYADVVDAIHVIQTEMGIAGTTADEAATTISGSLGMMKSSWANVVTAIASDELPFDDYVNDFITSVTAVTENVMPRIEIALNGIVKLIDKLAPIIISKVPSLFSTLLPSIITAATGLINSLVSTLPGIFSVLTNDVLPGLVDGIHDILYTMIFSLGDIMGSLTPMIPELAASLIDLAVGVFVMLAQELPAIIEPILSMLPSLISKVSDALIGSSYMLLEFIPAAINDIVSLLPTYLPIILTAIISLVQNIVTELPQILQELVSSALMLVDMLAEQLPVILPMLIDALIMIITMLTEQLPVILPMLINAVITIVMALVDALPTIITALVNALPGILQAVWDAIVMVFKSLPEWFGQIFSGIFDIIENILGAIAEVIGIDTSAMVQVIKAGWNAIKNYISTVVNAIKNVISTVWNSIKNVISTVINSVKNVISTVWNAIKTIIANVMNIIFSVIKGDWESVKNSISNILNAIRSVISSVWNAIKSIISSVLNGIKNTISSVFNGVRNIISSAVDGIKSIVTTRFNAIKESMEKPIQKARDTIKGIVDKIKGFFSGMKLEFPNIKLPHFSVTPSGWKIGDLLKGSIPKLGISWYAKAMNNPMIMNTPTVFGFDPSTGTFQGGGEAGSEVVSGTNTLMNMIGQAVSSQMTGVTYYLQQLINILADYFPQILESMERDIVADDGTVIAHYAPLFDREFGKMKDRKDRGR